MAPLVAGVGGTGGGVNKYGAELVAALNDLEHEGLEIVIFARPGQLHGLDRCTIVEIDIDPTRLLMRLLYIHLILPVLCITQRIDLLHKLASERPVWVPRTQVVVTVHDFMTEFLAETFPSVHTSIRQSVQRKYFTFMARLSLSCSSAVIVPSCAVAEEAHARYQARCPVKVVYNGLDQVLPNARGVPREQRSAVLDVLYVASFSPHKGQAEALGAIEKSISDLSRDGVRVRLTFHGHIVDPTYYRQVREHARSLADSFEVRFQEYSSSRSMADMYAAADVLMLLSRYEGFGLPPVEAQIQGVPVVCSMSSPFPEILGDGALYVNPASPKDVAGALRKVAAGEGMDELVAAGKRNAQRFSWKNTAVQTVDTYGRVMEGER